ncbi:MAG: PTS sugar transporter subunit IIC [Elusimicrobiota bacterium]|jgi:mannose/fructose/N-acetylgalactosamine-specific phosphotransferase system component IIC|nr:PTS sugar transporter subunit IIC [Elusimicrobiota bacterium]
MTLMLLLCVLAAFLELDTTCAGQFLISRPLVAGSVLGALTGNFFIGLQLGVFIELIYLDFLPIGGVVPPSGAITAALAVLLFHFFDVPAHFAFFFAVALGILFSFAQKRIRRYRGALLPSLEQGLIKGAIAPAALIAQSLFLEFLAAFAFLMAALTIIGPLYTLYAPYMPNRFDIAFQFSYFIVPWVGLSVLFISFSTKPKAD